jgi:hypothetical protein
MEMFGRFVTRMHKVNRDISRITTNKEDKVFETPITRGKRTTNIRMNTLERACSAMAGLLQKGGALDICSSADGT